MHPEYTPKFIERFWLKVDSSGGPDSCWPFLGCIVNGYGRVWVDGKLRGAHRVALELGGGSLSDGLWSLHTCDFKPCCNPKHLYAGTVRDNVRDWMERGGERPPTPLQNYHRGKGDHHYAKFSDDEVRSIRCANAAGETTIGLARRYGVPQGTIWRICRRKTYKQVA